MDLLLDTLCNTFGGLVFIALLLSLLVQQTAVVHSPNGSDVALADAELEVIEAYGRLQAVTEAMIALRQQIDRDRGRLANYFGLDDEGFTTDFARDAIDLLIALDARAEAERARIDAEGRAAAAERKLAEAAGAVMTAKQALADARDEARRISAEKRVTLRVPRERASSKSQRALLLHGGRLRQLFVYDASGNPIRLNRDEIDVSPLETIIAPIRFRGGDPVVDRNTAATSLRRRLGAFSPARHYVLITVWPDSHGSFRLVRDALVEQGYDYQLLLMEEGESVQLGGRSPATVQ